MPVLLVNYAKKKAPSTTPATSKTELTLHLTALLLSVYLAIEKQQLTTMSAKRWERNRRMPLKLLIFTHSVEVLKICEDVSWCLICSELLFDEKCRRDH